MIKLIKLICIVVLIALCSSCSSISYNSSKSEILNERAIKAVELRDGVGIGVDIASLDILGKHPIRQIIAAALDFLAIYVAYEEVDSIDISISFDKSNNSSN